MAHQKASSGSEFLHLRNAEIALPPTVALIFIEETIHIPLWFSVPFVSMVVLGARYVYLKRAEAKHYGE